MNITLLGTGMQGWAALFDLARSERVRSITAADRDVDGLRAFVREKKLPKVSCERVDASDLADVRRVVRPGTDVPYDLFAEEMRKRGITLQQRTTAGLAKGRMEV